jgi:hypothetical protein
MLGYCVSNDYKYFTGMNYVDQLQSNLPKSNSNWNVYINWKHLMEELQCWNWYLKHLLKHYYI